MSYCLGLNTQNAGLKEVDLEPSSKRCSDKDQHAETRKKHQKESKPYHTAWTHIWILARGEVDLEPV